MTDKPEATGVPERRPIAEREASAAVPSPPHDSPVALLLDVDGVLNVPAQTGREGWSTCEVPGPLDDGRTYLLTTNPQHTFWLLELSPMVELIWCTTWWPAKERIAELLGLPAGLDAVPLPRTFADVNIEMCRKTPFVRRWARGRAIAWIDDEVDERDERALVREVAPGERSVLAGTRACRDALVVPVAQGVGLTRAHVDRIRAWAETVKKC
jgi:hypothetical protein